MSSKILRGKYIQIRCQTSFSWNRLRLQTVPRTKLEQLRSGKVFMMKSRSTMPFSWGGGLRMVVGLLGIQPYQSNWNANVLLQMLAYRYHPEFCLALFNTLADNLQVCYLTCPKLTAACCAEPVNITAVKYSASSTRLFRDFGNSVNSGNMYLSCVHLQLIWYTQTCIKNIQQYKQSHMLAHTNVHWHSAQVEPVLTTSLIFKAKEGYVLNKFLNLHIFQNRLIAVIVDLDHIRNKTTGRSIICWINKLKSNKN